MLGFNRDHFETLKFHIENVNASSLLCIPLKEICRFPFVVVCIGTDRYIGDCLGPLVGYNLKNLKVKYPVYGTIQEPIHAMNLKENLAYIKSEYPDHTIISIDASLGNKKSVGTIQFREGPIYPGKGVGKNLPPVGDYSLIGVVDTVDTFKNTSSHQIRLSFVMEMADVITDCLCKATPNALYAKG